MSTRRLSIPYPRRAGASLLLGAAALGLALITAVGAPIVPAAGAAETAAEPAATAWRPQVVVEALVKLPASALQKRIERDFLDSPLGQAVRRSDEDIRFKLRTLGDLAAAIEMAEGGDQLLELRHQYLVEKQAYVALAGERNGLLRRELETRRRLLERVLAELGEEEGTMTESRRALIEQQGAARKRLEAAVAMADGVLADNPFAGESRYAREYEEKRAALEVLRERIANHPMNRDPVIDGETVTKREYVRHLVAATEGELALLDMEDEMLGHMAKLVALDALALAEEVEDPELADSDVPEPTDVAGAVRFFVQ